MNLRRRDLLIASGVWLLVPREARAQIGIRRLDLRNPNTTETFSGPYRDASGPIPAAMADLAVFLRDFHADKIGPVHVATLDFLADVMAATGQAKATVLSAYRTKATNDMLRAALFPAAEKSQHLIGRALDIAFDTRLQDAEKAALAMKRGGVGWYPNAHFIHLDSGPVRHWEIGGGGIENVFTAARPRRVLSHRELMLRYRAYARHEFMLRRGK